MLGTGFAESPLPLFDDPPGCYLHHQGNFVPQFFPEDAGPGLDYDVFALPEIDARWDTPVLGAGELIVMFNDTPQAQELLRYLVAPVAQEIWAERGGFVSFNRHGSLNAYPNPVARNVARMLVGAEFFRFDASDLMPPEVGAGAFWEGALSYIAGAELDQVLIEIEASAQEAYGP